MIEPEQITVIQREPLILLLQIPDGVEPGTWGAAKQLAEVIAKLNSDYPRINFQHLPYGYGVSTDGKKTVLCSILAIAISAN